MNLEDGYLIILERDNAKAFFGHRDDADRLEFINELLSNADVPKTSLQGKWQALHDSLAAIEIEDSVLAQCVLGGRPMHQGDDFHVCLVRPDVVQFIAEQSKSVDLSPLDDEVSDLAKATFETFSKAVELRAAVVFAAKR